jgi:hypothetical protein
VASSLRPADDYIVAIPSYQRAKHLAERTLPLLLDGEVHPRRIHVFLHDNDPTLTEYADLAEKYSFNLVVTSKRGITAQRTGIADTFPAGTPVVSMDDDVTAFMAARDAKTLTRVTDVDALFRHMFAETAERGLAVWGFAPVPNAFFLKPDKISEGLKFLIFTCYGYFSRPGHPVHTHTVPYKDENELSLRAWYYDGAVVRHDGIAAKANFYTLEGGCQAAGRSHEEIEASVKSLLTQWPGLVRINTNRKSEHTEIVLARRARWEGAPLTALPPGVSGG